MTGLRILAALALACVTLIVTTNAEARQRHKTYAAHPDCNVLWPCEGVTTSARGEAIVKAMGGFGSAQKVYTPRAAVRQATAAKSAAALLPVKNKHLRGALKTAALGSKLT